MSPGRQAVGTPGAGPVCPGTVPSARSQTWGRCSTRRAATVEARGGWCCKDLLWGRSYKPFFLLLKKPNFSLPRGAQCPGHPRKLLLGLLLGHHAEWPWPSPFVQDPNTCTKHLLITYTGMKEPNFMSFCDASCASHTLCLAFFKWVLK